MRYTLLFLVLFCFFIDNNAKDWYKDVEIDSGPVRGYLAEGGDYYAFLGIPYATAPLGRRRFRAPFPAPYWEDILSANRTVKCPQYGEGDEDCLVINVFTPTKIVNGPLPVLVYIHGGSFIIGSGPTKGVELILKQNVIVVTFNYRLGALGFLCLGIENAPGNAGLKDQIAALKWVRGNIAKFGGDPKQVTLYGMCSGGSSVEFLILSDSAKDLFHKAVIESGTATSVCSVDAEPLRTASNLAQTLKISKKKIRNIFRLADFYRDVDARRLSAVNFQMYQNLTDGTFGFAPCIEQKVVRVAPLITSQPLNKIEKGEYNNVPIMFIFASSEGLFLRSSEYQQSNYKERMNTNFGDFMPADLVFDNEEIKDIVTGNVKAFYFKNETIGDYTKTKYLNYFGDHYILHGLLNSAIAYSKNNTVYLLEFAYKGNMGSFDKDFDDLNLAGHGDAIKYVIFNKPLDKNDKLIADRMVKIVANFMKYSNPIPTRTDLLPCYWPPVKPNNVSYLQMNNELQVFEEPNWDTKNFWDSLYGTFRRNIKPVDPGLM